jgi:hypothetical protein
MKLKTARILSILPVIFILLTAGCDATKYPEIHPIMGIISLAFAALTTISLFLLKG